MIVTVRFLFLLILLLQFGTKHLVVHHLRNFHGMLSVPANDPKRLNGRVSDPDFSLFRTWGIGEQRLLLKDDINCHRSFFIAGLFCIQTECEVMSYRYR